MKKVLFFILLIVTVTFGRIMASNNEGEGSGIDTNSSTAEMEFISQIHDLDAICMKKLNNLESCMPEVIVVDEEYQVIAAGFKANYIIDQLIPGSNYLTTVLGIEYYALDFSLSGPLYRLVTQK